MNERVSESLAVSQSQATASHGYDRHTHLNESLPHSFHSIDWQDSCPNSSYLRDLRGKT